MRQDAVGLAHPSLGNPPAGLGERMNAPTILVILIASVGLGFAGEYRAQQAAEALHDQLGRTCVT